MPTENLPQYKVIADVIVSPTDDIVVGLEDETVYIGSATDGNQVATTSQIQGIQSNIESIGSISRLSVLTSLRETFPVLSATSAVTVSSSGIILTWMKPQFLDLNSSETFNSISFFSVTGQASVAFSVVKYGLYELAADGSSDATLIAQTIGTPGTTFKSNNVKYSKLLYDLEGNPFSITANEIADPSKNYGIALLTIGTGTMPTIAGSTAIASNLRDSYTDSLSINVQNNDFPLSFNSFSLSSSSLYARFS